MRTSGPLTGLLLEEGRSIESCCLVSHAQQSNPETEKAESVVWPGGICAFSVCAGVCVTRAEVELGGNALLSDLAHNVVSLCVVRMLHIAEQSNARRRYQCHVHSK